MPGFSFSFILSSIHPWPNQCLALPLQFINIILTTYEKITISSLSDFNSFPQVWGRRTPKSALRPHITKPYEKTLAFITLIFTSITLTELGTNGGIGEEVQRQLNGATAANAGYGERIPVSSNDGRYRNNNIVTLSLIIQITLKTIHAIGAKRPDIYKQMCRPCRLSTAGKADVALRWRRMSHIPQCLIASDGFLTSVALFRFSDNSHNRNCQEPPASCSLHPQLRETSQCYILSLF